MPYLESLGFPGRYKGWNSVEGFFKFVRDLYPNQDTVENVAKWLGKRS
jgi:hypothetical protein